MAGILLVLTIPTTDHEKELIKLNNTEEINNSERVSFLPTVKPCADGLSKKEETLVSFLDSPLPETASTSHEKTKFKFEISSDSSLEEITSSILSTLKVENYSWVPVKSNKFIYVLFCVEAGPCYEEALRLLTKWGIGTRLKSTLGVIPCSLYYTASGLEDDEEDSENTSQKNKESKSPWDEFVLSVVRSRLAVAQVVEEVKGNAKLTFDFVSLIILAGTIAGVGLVENSTVSIVASMLISPLMGPILAGTFGAVIHDRKLQIIGVRNELLGLLLTVLVGFLIGLIIGSVDDYYGTGQWPTPEMMSRGQLRSLWVGVLIALPSGAGVALGLLSDNSGSLIGVAISASLLPPAVNAGLFWALAILEAILDRSGLNHDHQFAEKVYSQHLPTELCLLGCVSLSLTLVNILCIFIAGILVLKIKEVAPRALTDEDEKFWHHDIKVARDYNKSLSKEDAKLLGKKMRSEKLDKKDVEGSANTSPSNEYLHSVYNFSPEVLRRLTNTQRKYYQNTWTGYNNQNVRKSSLADLENLYASLGGQELPTLRTGQHWRLGMNRAPWSGLKCDDDDLLRRSTFLAQRGHRFVVTKADNDPLSQQKK